MTLIRSTVVLLLSLLAATPLAAQERRVPQSPAELRLSYAPIVQRVQPAVVNVYAAKVVQNRNPFLDDPIFRRFFGLQGGPQEQMQRSLGSGVMVDASGLVVTNVHVIEGADEVKVSLSDKREFEAEIVLKDSRTDLAVLRLKGTRETFPTLDLANSDDLLVGDVVLAIGNPFGVGQTVTHGIVSALARTQVGITDYQFFIQTDAAINPGNSGGPLLDSAGRLIGVNTAIYSPSGASAGIGFAVPVDKVNRIVPRLIASGRYVSPSLGIRTDPKANEALSARLNMSGVFVLDVEPDSAAEKAGLIPARLTRDGGFALGDVLLAIDGQVVDSPDDMTRALETKTPGDRVVLRVRRAGKTIEVRVTLDVAR